MHPINFIQQHPIFSFVVTAIHLFAAENVYKLELPKILMQTMQCGAWAITIVVGCITVIGFIKNKNKNHEQKK